MGISKFFKKNISSFNRTIKKKKVIQDVLNRSQINTDLICVHRIDKSNVGDYYCAPHLYFENLSNKKLDIFDFKSTNKIVTDNWIDNISNNSLIIGGGGLLNRSSFEMQMKLFETLSKKGKKIVLWGVGHNSKKKNPKIQKITTKATTKNI